jgi:hypothetical protein
MAYRASLCNNKWFSSLKEAGEISKMAKIHDSGRGAALLNPAASIETVVHDHFWEDWKEL